jgi:deoxycytidylate deaminase
MNLILELATQSKPSGGISIYVTHSPCNNCMKHLLGLQRNGLYINKIVYDKVYHRASAQEIEYNKKRSQELGIEYYEIR